MGLTFMAKQQIYLDYNATTPCDPLVIEAMLPFFSEVFANPANGLHQQGRMAADRVEDARAQVAHMINAQPSEIIFTGGATESNNLAVRGIAEAQSQSSRKRIITSAIEHKSVLAACQKLQERGYELVVLPVDRYGRVDLDALAQSIDDRTLLVSVHAANNEIGTLQPIADIAAIAHDKGAIVHCDAAQAVAKVLVDVHEWDVDLLSFSAHKMYGPKGIGALYLRGGARSFPIEPILYGGGHEKGLRSGTLNVPAIVGFGEASRICAERLDAEQRSIATLRDTFEEQICRQVPAVKINGARDSRLPNTSSLTFPGVDADALLLNVPNLMLATGSACAAGTVEPSHVLQAIGVSRTDAHSTIRVSIGRYTTEDDIKIAVNDLAAAYTKLRH